MFTICEICGSHNSGNPCGQCQGEVVTLHEPRQPVVFNMTAHNINVIREDGSVEVFNPCGEVARVSINSYPTDLESILLNRP